MPLNPSIAVNAWNAGQDTLDCVFGFTVQERLFQILLSAPFSSLVPVSASEHDDSGWRIKKYEPSDFPLRDEPEDSWLLFLTRSKWSMMSREDFVVIPNAELVLMRRGDVDATGFHDFRGCMLVLPSQSLMTYDRMLLKRQAGKVRLKTGWGKVLSSYIDSLDLPLLVQTVGDESAWLMLEQHIMALLRRALLGGAEARGVQGQEHDAQEALRSKGEVLFQRLCHWISDNYANPDMSSDFVANQFGISSRYIQNLFSKYGDGVTFVSFVRDRRIRRAWEMLTSVEFMHHSISEICWNCGFSDPVYFGKIFRRFYGATPSTVRKNSLREVAGYI